MEDKKTMIERMLTWENAAGLGMMVVAYATLMVLLTICG